MLVLVVETIQHFFNMAQAVVFIEENELCFEPLTLKNKHKVSCNIFHMLHVKNVKKFCHDIAVGFTIMFESKISCFLIKNTFILLIYLINGC